ncbi:MAG TPA: DnaJ domain-containing protein [Candidatus Binatia bacterium]|nr:DnaJ domain-containing protein [Candidatus Binatia bacterium]
MVRKNYYLTLGISRNENTEGIRQAFREIVKRYHPDRVGSGRLRFFQEIVEAYHVLADPERRSHYDQGLYHAGLTAGVPPGPVSVGLAGSGDLPQATSVLRILSVKDAPFEAALARVSGSLTGVETTSKELPEALNAVVVLSPDEAAKGGVVLLGVPSCSPCERCGASGREGLFPCRLCDGEGLIEEEEMVRVHVPPRVGDGAVIDVPLRGLGVHNFYLRLHIRLGS